MNALTGSIMQEAGLLDDAGMDPSLQGLPSEHPLLQRAQKKLAEQMQDTAQLLREELRGKEYALKV